MTSGIRKFQEEKPKVESNDVSVSLPTGYGKSVRAVIFIVPPLEALIEYQVHYFNGLEPRG